MTDPVPFHRAELEADLRQLKSFAQAAAPAADQAGSALLRFSIAVSAFVDAVGTDPDASPRELLLAAGEANARLEALHSDFDCAMNHLERLPFKLDLGAVIPHQRLPEDPRPESLAHER